jgi:hypothetical protein
MNSSQDDQLDRLLKDWANRTASGAEDLEVLQTRIDEARDADTPPGVELAIQRSLHGRWRIVACVTAAAAVLVVAVALRQHVVPDGAVGSGMKPISNAAMQYPNPLPLNTWTIDQHAELLAKFREVFGDDLTWIVQEGGQISVGLQETRSAKRAANGEFVTVQLMLWARPINNDGREQFWRQLESFNIVTGSEELVEAHMNEDGKMQLRVWAFPVDDDLISIDVQYQTADLSGVIIESSSLQPAGRDNYRIILSFEKDGMEYRLYQIADLLHENDLG